MRVRFWGVRGSIASPGATTVRFGGNTSCVEISAGNATLIFDAGTGIRALGDSIRGKGPTVAHLFFSHVHWDHIQGFPFFSPAYGPANKLVMHGARGPVEGLRETLESQMSHPTFPVKLDQMRATMVFEDVVDNVPIVIDDGLGDTITVHSAKGNHPDGVRAYRVEHKGKAVVYATDTEHGEAVDDALKQLSRNASLLIYDTMYTPEEYDGSSGGPSRRGWGHSTFEAGVDLAKAANVDTLVLFHHDPSHDDDAVVEIERRAQALFPKSIAAFEGQTFDL